MAFSRDFLHQTLAKLPVSSCDCDLILRFLPATGAPVLNVDDAGGIGLPVIFQHGLCGDARQTIEAFPQEQTFPSNYH